MIDKQELRLGNHVWYDGGRHVITSLRPTHCESLWIRGKNYDQHQHPYKLIEPIKITGDELLNWGFKLNHQNKEYKHYKLPNNFFVSIAVLDDDIIGAKAGDVIWGENYRIINNIHQLQNGYFIWTGEELTYADIYH